MGRTADTRRKDRRRPFDFIDPTPGIRLTLIADISGKGISAAMALTLLRFTFRHLARETQSPADLASRMSLALFDEWHGSPYVTCVIARVDLATRTLTYVNAGHPPGVLASNDGDRELAEGGPPLGLLPCARYVEEQLNLIGGDICTFMTDGITEAFDDGLRSWGEVVLTGAGEGQRSAWAVCNDVMSRSQEAHGPNGVEGWTEHRTVVVIRVSDALPAS